MPVAVAIVPSMPARPRLACTGIRLPGATRSSSRMRREAASTSRSCGQVACQTASTRARRVTGARSSASCVARERRALGVVVGEGGAERLVLLERLAGHRDPPADPGTLRLARRRGRRRSSRRRRRSAPGGRGCSRRCPGCAPRSSRRPARSISAGTSRLSVGCPNTIDALDAVAEVAGRQQLAVGGDEVRAEAGAGCHLGEQRSAERAGGRLRLLARAGPRDDDGARTRRSSRVVGRLRPPESTCRARHPAASTAADSGSRNARFTCTGPAIPSSTAAASATAAASWSPPSSGAGTSSRACGGAEDAGLTRGLVRADAAQLGRPVGA